MADEMEKDAIEIASYALNEFVIEREMANHIKREFDKKYRCAAPPRGSNAATQALPFVILDNVSIA